jgi:predicted transposase/invertase (TIGR01784 family)
MLLAEYDYDTDIAVQRREAFDDGLSQGRNEGISIGEKLGEERGRNEGISIGLSQAKIETAKNALTMNLSIEQVATLTGLSVEEIEKL